MKLFKKNNQTDLRQKNKPPAAGRYNYIYYVSRRTNAQNKAKPQPALSKLIYSNITISICLLVIISSMLYATLLSSAIKLSISPPGSFVYRQKNDYQLFISQEINKSVLNNFKPSFSKTKLITAIKASYPEVKDASITVPVLGRKPVIDLELFKPAFNLIQNGQIFIGNENGKLLAQVNSPNNKIITITDESKISDQVGTAPISSQDMALINEVALQLNSQSINLSRLVLPNIPNELHIYTEGRNYYLKFALNGSPRMQSGAAVAAIHKLDKDGIVPSEYIDLRIEDKAFYK